MLLQAGGVLLFKDEFLDLGSLFSGEYEVAEGCGGVFGVEGGCLEWEYRGGWCGWIVPRLLSPEAPPRRPASNRATIRSAAWWCSLTRSSAIADVAYVRTRSLSPFSPASISPNVRSSLAIPSPYFFTVSQKFFLGVSPPPNYPIQTRKSSDTPRLTHANTPAPRILVITKVAGHPHPCATVNLSPKLHNRTIGDKTTGPRRDRILYGPRD